MWGPLRSGVQAHRPSQLYQTATAGIKLIDLSPLTYQPTRRPNMSTEPLILGVYYSARWCEGRPPLDPVRYVSK